MTTFTNEKRLVRTTYEGFGEYRTAWPEYEVKCPCGRWTEDYGDVSEVVTTDPDVQTWLCPRCVRQLEEAEAEQMLARTEADGPLAYDLSE
jgi:hypothetical protein